METFKVAYALWFVQILKKTYGVGNIFQTLYIIFFDVILIFDWYSL